MCIFLRFLRQKRGIAFITRLLIQNGICRIESLSHLRWPYLCAAGNESCLQSRALSPLGFHNRSKFRHFLVDVPSGNDGDDERQHEDGVGDDFAERTLLILLLIKNCAEIDDLQLFREG